MIATGCGRWTEPLRQQSREADGPFDEDRKAPSRGDVLLRQSQDAEPSQGKKEKNWDVPLLFRIVIVTR